MPFGIIFEATIIEHCVIAKVGRTRVERKLAKWFGNDVGVLQILQLTWGKYFQPREVDSRHHVDSKLKLFRDMEGYVSESSPAFQMGHLLPTTRYERSICVSTCSEHKSVSIFKMGSIVFYVT